MMERTWLEDGAGAVTDFTDTLTALAGRAAGLVLLLLALPALALRLARGWHAGTRLVRRAREGRDGRRFEELALEPHGGWATRWPALGNVVRGEMALVGPRARCPGELDPRDPRTREVQSVPPGLVSPWWIRLRRGLDHGAELDADVAYVAERGPRHDAGVLARALAAGLGGEAGDGAGELRVLGVRCDAISMDDAVDRIAALAAGGPPRQVCFANADCLNLACVHPEYRRTLEVAPLVLPDGTGVRLASRLAGRPIRWDVNGTDLFPHLCRRLAADGRRVFLLGARPGVAERVGEWIARHHPGLAVAGAHHGYFTPAEEPDVIARIRAARPDVLLVAFGAPRQDVWIRDHARELGVPVALGVGGLFDFYSDALPRAPLWMRELGLEWSFRLWQEPGRLWRRYLIGNVTFLTRAILEAGGVVRYVS